MFNPTPDMKKHLDEAPSEVKGLLAKLLSDAILGSNIPEEDKIEVRIMMAYEDLDDLLCRTSRRFATPIPPQDEATKKRIYPARQAFLEYLNLTKAGLENFLANVPVPDIPPRVYPACGEL